MQLHGRRHFGIIDAVRKSIIYLAVAIFAALVLPAEEKPDSSKKVPILHETTGVVVFSHPWNFILLDNGEGVLRVTADQGYPGLNVGDTITAVGVLGMRKGRTALESAQYTKLDRPHVEVPVVDVKPEELASMIASGNIKFGARMRITARLLGVEKKTWGVWESRLDVPQLRFMVSHKETFPGDVLEVADLEPLVEVVGALTYEADDTGKIQYAVLCVQEASEMRLVPDAAFERRKKLKMLRNAWLLIPALAVVLIVFLFIKFIGARREKLRLAAIVNERKRMAADLHDTIEQHLAGAAMFLDSVLPIDGSPTPKELAPVETARNILMTAKREIRETVWNLRVGELVAQRPEDVLRRLAVRAAECGTARIHARLRGLPESMPQNVFSDLIFIVQEAMANAMKHGQAKNISLVSDPMEGGCLVRVVNDGEPFDVSASLIPEAGHFGLSGMRERARRSGMKIAFESNEKHTIVSLEVRR